jgi:peptidyl-prolyl cis-trans isomerase SurA
MMKRLSPLALGLALWLAATPAGAVEEGIAAVVNDSVITMSDVRERAALYLSGQQAGPEERKKVEQQVLGRLIDEALQVQEAKKLEINIDESQVNTGFAYVAKQNNATPDDFRRQLKEAGVNVDTLFAQIRAQLAWEQVVRRQLRPRVSVTESDIDMTLGRLAVKKKQYRVSQIVLPVKDAASEKDVRARAEALAKKLKDGAGFPMAAHEYSQDAAASNGGDIGWVEEGQLEPALDQALQALQPGQVSAPVRAGSGWYILHLRETRAGAEAVAEAAPAAEDVYVTVKQILIPVDPAKDSDAVIRAKHARGVALKKEIASCAEMDKRMKDFPAKGTGTLGTAKESSLQEPLRGLVSRLAVNQLSEPLQAPGGWAMLMVCDRSNKGPDSNPLAGIDAGSEDARSSVADRLGQQRLGRLADHYLRDLRAAAFIDKRI